MVAQHSACIQWQQPSYGSSFLPADLCYANVSSALICIATCLIRTPVAACLWDFITPATSLQSYKCKSQWSCTAVFQMLHASTSTRYGITLVCVHSLDLVNLHWLLMHDGNPRAVIAKVGLQTAIPSLQFHAEAGWKARKATLSIPHRRRLWMTVRSC